MVVVSGSNSRALAIDLESMDFKSPVRAKREPSPLTETPLPPPPLPQPPTPPPPPPPPPPPLPLDPDQQRALDVAKAGGNVFLTGGAGVGKSHTLKAIIAALQEMHGERCVAVAASTGCAAVHIDGQTLHSLAGVGIPMEVRDFGRIHGLKAEVWRGLKALVIDEVSMLDAEYLDCVPSPSTRRGDRMRLCFLAL